MNREIKVCSNCEIPLIWTFHFPGAEYFCINCGYLSGMLGAGENVDETPELKNQLKHLKRLWKIICKYSLPKSQFGRVGCKKCTGANHWQHITKRERLQNKIADNIIKEFYGCFAN